MTDNGGTNTVSDRGPLGRALRNARTEARLSQVEAAGLIEVSQPALSAWERGQSKPSLDRLAKAAHVYGVDFAELVSDALNGAVA